MEVGVRPLSDFLRGRTVAVMKMDVEANEVAILKVDQGAGYAHVRRALGASDKIRSEQ